MIRRIDGRGYVKSKKWLFGQNKAFGELSRGYPTVIRQLSTSYQHFGDNSYVAQVLHKLLLFLWKTLTTRYCGNEFLPYIYSSYFFHNGKIVEM